MSIGTQGRGKCRYPQTNKQRILTYTRNHRFVDSTSYARQQISEILVLMVKFFEAKRVEEFESINLKNVDPWVTVAKDDAEERAENAAAAKEEAGEESGGEDQAEVEAEAEAEAEAE